MPDSRMPHNEPRNWSDAFAALPLEAPPRDAWPRIAAEIRTASPQRHARRRHAWWTAMAAALALAIVIPLALRPDGTPPPASAVTPPAAETPKTAPLTPAKRSVAEVRGRASTGIVQTTRPPETRIARAKPRPKQPAIGTSADETALATLYAQSAQLEALVARMQDESFATGPAAVLAGELENRVALIDASLAQPELATAQRAVLWRERVDALRQLADFESTQRLLAAEGERYDGQLVAVY